MDQEVARTLGELELKLRELERELASIGERQAQVGVPVAAPPPPPPPPSPPAMGRLVDEAVEQRYALDARETIYGEIPATRDCHEAIDLAELVRFKETMQRTLQGLIDEYGRLLSLRPPAGDS